LRRSLIGVILLALLLTTALAAPVAAAEPGDGSRLPRWVKLENIRKHQKALQDIAAANGGSRSAGTAGYEISGKYVEKQITRDKDLNEYYTVTRDPFEYNHYEQLGPSTLAQTQPNQVTYTEGMEGDYLTFTYSGDGDVTASVQAVDTAGANSGCEAADFAGFTAGNVALIKRGACTFEQKAANAQTAGAVAVVIFNDGADPTREGPVAGTLGRPFPFPVLGPSFALGSELVGLAAAGTLQLHVAADTLNEVRDSFNVLIESRRGAADNVVVVGAHLDSVPEGPGINDNGSGTAAILEIAKQLPRLGDKVKNKVRFAFWGAEELGLLGSEAYVAEIKASGGLANVALNLNFDMLGSPNFVRFVYDGDNSAFPPPGAAVGPPGSGAIEKAFVDHFSGRDLQSEPTPFSGRSDYGPFIAEGVPAGGLFSGAEGVKTPEQAAVYGGAAGQAYDPCYHQACDTYDNNNDTGLDQLSDAAAGVTEQYAYSTLTVNGAAPRRLATTQATPLTAFEFKGHLLQR
jgi:Zn-dependent M28 family amino/carboxypeptidase